MMLAITKSGKPIRDTSLSNVKACSCKDQLNCRRIDIPGAVAQLGLSYNNSHFLPPCIEWIMNANGRKE